MERKTLPRLMPFRDAAAYAARSLPSHSIVPDEGTDVGPSNVILFSGGSNSSDPDVGSRGDFGERMHLTCARWDGLIE